MEKAKILIVEDEIVIAREVENSLQTLGYEVTSIVDTGEKAIKKAESDKPDLILMDIRIKGEMDGIETAKIIRNRFEIPVIFSTAYLDEGRIDRAKITMPFGYVLKPIQERDLKVTIEMALYVAKADIERRRAEEKLKESDSQRRAWLENSPDCTKIVDLDFNLQYMSSAGVEGLKIPDITQYYGKRYPFDFYPESFKKPMSENLAKARETGEIITQEADVVDVDGNVIWFHSTIVPVSNSGQIEYLMVVSIDVTERKQTEEALRKSHEELEEKVAERTEELQHEIDERRQIEEGLLIARKDAESANQSKSEFLANISHELRNPMHQILSYSKYGIDKIDKPKEKLLHYFNQSRKAAERMMVLLNCIR